MTANERAIEALKSSRAAMKNIFTVLESVSQSNPMEGKFQEIFEALCPRETAGKGYIVQIDDAIAALESVEAEKGPEGSGVLDSINNLTEVLDGWEHEGWSNEYIATELMGYISRKIARLPLAPPKVVTRDSIGRSFYERVNLVFGKRFRTSWSASEVFEGLDGVYVLQIPTPNPAIEEAVKALESLAKLSEGGIIDQHLPDFPGLVGRRIRQAIATLKE